MSLLSLRWSHKRRSPHRPRRVRPCLELLECRTLPAIFTVNVTHDLVNDLADPADRSLREAILVANANPGLDTIAFAIPGAGPHTIRPTSELPALTDAVIIDGGTQPGFAGSPMIELDGSFAGEKANGLAILAGDSTVRGLVINRFHGNGIKLETGDGNVIEGNYLGTDVTGTIALTPDTDEFGRPWQGFSVAVFSNRNRIGTDGDGVNDLAERNLLAFGLGSGAFAVVYSAEFSFASRLGADENVVAGNFIGIDATGTVALIQPGEFNETFGVALEGRLNRIGTNGDGLADAAERNVIAGFHTGVMLLGDENAVAGNFIGTDVTGTQALGNVKGVVITQGHFNRIGTNGDGLADAAERNVISGNISYGVLISGDTVPSADPPITSNNVVAGNYIGTDVSGTRALGNRTGIGVMNANANRIGTNGDGVADDAESNLISANVAGIIIGHIFNDVEIVYERLLPDFPFPPRPDSPTEDARHTLENVIAGNFIGTDASGAVALGNGIGLFVRAHQNRIGTDGNGLADAAERNVISGNGEGVYIRGNRNVLAGNAIGVNAAGAPLANGNYEDLPMCPDDHPGQPCTLVQTRSQAILYDFREGFWGTYYLNDASEFALTSDPVELSFRFKPLDGPAFLRGTGATIAGSQNVIGGEGNLGNTIAFNTGPGVAVRPAPFNLTNPLQFFPPGYTEGLLQALPTIPTGNAIRGNSIHANGALGIDLDGDGVTLNDPLDADATNPVLDFDGGPSNKMQNFPILTNVQRGASTRVVGALHSAANASFTLDFYASAGGDPSGFGEGERYLGWAAVTTGADGSVDFDVVLAAATSAGEVVTATATDADGNTSEFSFAPHGTVSARVISGRLVIRSDGQQQAIQIAPGAAGLGSYLVTDIQGTRAFNAMMGLDIDLGGGADVIFLTGAARTLEVSGALDVRTGAGADRVLLNRVWAQGSATLDTGPGDNLLMALVASFRADVKVLAGSGKDRIDLDGVHARGNTRIDTAAGDDEVALRNSHFRGPFRMETGDGHDLVTVLDSIFARDFAVDTGAGRDRLRLKDATMRGPAVLDTGQQADELMVADSRFQRDLSIWTGAGNDRVIFDRFESFIGDSRVVVRGNAHIDTGDGDDEVVLLESIFKGNLEVRTGAGADSIYFGFSELDDVNQAAVFGRTDLDTGAGNDGVVFERVLLRGSVAIRTGLGADTVRFTSSRILQSVLLHTGAGADGVLIENSVFRGAVWIGLDTGHDELVIEDYESEQTVFFERVDVWTGPEEDTVSIGPGVVFHKGFSVKRSLSPFVS